MLASGASRADAMRWANRAAGVVVGKLGTATCSLEELQE
jgi:bifunctional ADP-heptose synthase (sugar kinase/adenylyltransferase)